MKIILVLAIASLGLAGCGSMDFWGDSSSTDDQSAPPPIAAASPAPPTTAAADEPAPTAGAPVAVVETTKLPRNPHCWALAKQRAVDAAYQGEDGDTQEAVHERTYAECVAWDLRHAFQ